MIKKIGVGVSVLIITALLAACGAQQSNPSVTTQSSVQPAASDVSSTVNAASSIADNTITNTGTGVAGSIDNTGNSSTTDDSSANEKAVAPEKNPPGDIPDTQVFVKYSSEKGGYELQVPEGWAQTENGTDVTFADKYDGLQVNVAPVSDPITLESVKGNQETDLKKTGRAVVVNSVKEVKLNGSQAFCISYDSNSDPNPVTNKQIRLENKNYYYWEDGKMAVVRVWAPLGADNVDQWNFISQNFKWRQT